MARRECADDPDALRELFVLVGDVDAVGALDRDIMGQPKQIQTDR